MVTLSEIQEAFLFVSSAGYGMNRALLFKDNDEIYYHSEMDDLDELDEDESKCNNFVEIPHKNDLDLGQSLVFEFAELHLADDLSRVEQIFHGRGAYGRFKDLLESKGLLQSWYDFENRREEEALREWARENEIELES
jgi:hypothetical protein